MDKFTAEDYFRKAVRARPATLSEMEDLVLDCYEAASRDGTAGWEVFDLVKDWVFDHVHYTQEKV